MGGAGNSGSGTGIGGAGLQRSITGTNVWYAGGGSGANAGDNANGGGTGSFGGGANAFSAGGGGVVILRYAGDATGITGGSTATDAVPGQAITTFTSGGTFSVDLAQRLGATLTAGITGDGDLAFTGPGRLTLAGANTYSGTTTISAGTLALGSGGGLASAAIDVASGARFDVSALAGAFTVGSSQELRGAGTILGSLLFGADSKLAFASSLAVDSGTVSFAGFGIDDIVGLDGTLVSPGTYTLLGGTATFDLSGALNVGFANRAEIGGGKQAYFNQGSLQVIVVPEPGLLAAAGVAILPLGLIRRRGLGRG